MAGFDDSVWDEGLGGFGGGSSVLGVLRTTWSTSRVSMRRTFTLTSIPPSLELSIYHGCSPEAYVNDVLIYSSAHDSGGYMRIPFDAAALSSLVVGVNQVAVRCQGHLPQYIDEGIGNYAW